MWKRLIFFIDYPKKFDIYNRMNYIIRDILKEFVSEKTEKPSLLPKNKGLEKIKSIKKGIESKLESVYFDITGEKLELPKIDIRIDNTIKKGKIAGFSHPRDGKSGIMGIKEKALEDEEYLKWVIMHELIHASIGEDLPQREEHKGLFKKIADRMGLPEKYQD